MDIWERAGLRAQAEVAVPKTDFATVSSWPVAKIREIADKQIKLTKESFEMASDVRWYEGLYVRFQNHKRWGPYLEKIKQAELMLKDGDGAPTDDGKRKSYLESWSLSRLTSEQIHKEANIGMTNYAMVAGDIGKSLAQTKKEIIDGALTLGGNVETMLKWGAGIALAVYVLSSTGKNR